MTDMMSDGFENEGDHTSNISTSPLPIHIRNDNRTCTKQPNAAVKVI